MKTIWARIGMALEVPDEEFEEIKNNMHRGFYDFNSESELGKRFIKDGYLDGDSYIPECCLEE